MQRKYEEESKSNLNIAIFVHILLVNKILRLL